jgi:hypothetical protein
VASWDRLSRARDRAVTAEQDTRAALTRSDDMLAAALEGEAASAFANGALAEAAG